MADIPQFEVVGPPCETPGCKGALVDFLCMGTRECLQRCSVCGQEFNRMPASEMLAWVNRTIERVLTGEKDN